MSEVLHHIWNWLCTGYNYIWNWLRTGYNCLSVAIFIAMVIGMAIVIWISWKKYNNMQGPALFVLILYGLVASGGMSVLNLVTYQGKRFFAHTIPSELPYLGILFFLMNFGTLIIIPMILSGLKNKNNANGNPAD